MAPHSTRSMSCTNGTVLRRLRLQGKNREELEGEKVPGLDVLPAVVIELLQDAVVVESQMLLVVDLVLREHVVRTLLELDEDEPALRFHRLREAREHVAGPLEVVIG